MQRILAFPRWRRGKNNLTVALTVYNARARTRVRQLCERGCVGKRFVDVVAAAADGCIIKITCSRFSPWEDVECDERLEATVLHSGLVEQNFLNCSRSR